MTGRRLLERPTMPLVVLIALATTGCGGPEPTSPAASVGDAPATRIVEHAMGATEVPAEPQRVVVLDTGELDSATALDVAPVGGVTALPGLPILEYLQTAAASMEVVGTIEEPDLEAVAALEPDLILSSELRHEKIYDELSQIAPTVFTETVGVTWKENFLIPSRRDAHLSQRDLHRDDPRGRGPAATQGAAQA